VAQLEPTPTAGHAVAHALSQPEYTCYVLMEYVPKNQRSSKKMPDLNLAASARDARYRNSPAEIAWSLNPSSGH
jgi:hypothetical protein